MIVLLAPSFSSITGPKFKPYLSYHPHWVVGEGNHGCICLVTQAITYQGVDCSELGTLSSLVHVTECVGYLCPCLLESIAFV